MCWSTPSRQLVIICRASLPQPLSCTGLTLDRWHFTARPGRVLARPEGRWCKQYLKLSQLSTQLSHGVQVHLLWAGDVRHHKLVHPILVFLHTNSQSQTSTWTPCTLYSPTIRGSPYSPSLFFICSSCWCLYSSTNEQFETALDCSNPLTKIEIFLAG